MDIFEEVLGFTEQSFNEKVKRWVFNMEKTNEELSDLVSQEGLFDRLKSNDLSTENVLELFSFLLSVGEIKMFVIMSDELITMHRNLNDKERGIISNRTLDVYEILDFEDSMKYLIMKSIWDYLNIEGGHLKFELKIN